MTLYYSEGLKAEGIDADGYGILDFTEFVAWMIVSENVLNLVLRPIMPLFPPKNAINSTTVSTARPASVAFKASGGAWGACSRCMLITCVITPSIN